MTNNTNADETKENQATSDTSADDTTTETATTKSTTQQSDNATVEQNSTDTETKEGQSVKSSDSSSTTNAIAALANAGNSMSEEDKAELAKGPAIDYSPVDPKPVIENLKSTHGDVVGAAYYDVGDGSDPTDGTYEGVTFADGYTCSIGPIIK